MKTKTIETTILVWPTMTKKYKMDKDVAKFIKKVPWKDTCKYESVNGVLTLSPTYQ